MTCLAYQLNGLTRTEVSATFILYHCNSIYGLTLAKESPSTLFWYYANDLTLGLVNCTSSNSSLGHEVVSRNIYISSLNIFLDAKKTVLCSAVIVSRIILRTFRTCFAIYRLFFSRPLPTTCTTLIRTREICNW